VLANHRDRLIKNPDYWKKYRRTHPASTELNRIQTRIRKRIRKDGLQTRIDILQPIESKMKFWSLARFANRPRSIFPLLCAYKPPVSSQGGIP